MNSSLDLNLLPFARQAGSEISELPDLYAVTPPRRTARGREGDSLIIYLSIAGNLPLPSAAQAQLMEKLADKFYKTTGSLTAALRTVAESLNLYLLDRNLRSTSAGRQGVGQLTLVALRGDMLYVTQCGSVHAFLVTPQETQHLYEPQSSGRGLGLSRTTPMRFVQLKMNPEEFLVLSTQASPGWMGTSLKYPQRQGIEDIRYQLLENGTPDFNAVIAQAQAGTGKFRVMKRKAEAPVMAHPNAAAPSTDTQNHFQPPEAEQPAPPPGEDRRPGLPPISAPAAVAAMGSQEDKKPGIPYSAATPMPQPTAWQAEPTPRPMAPPAPETAAVPTGTRRGESIIPPVSTPEPPIQTTGTPKGRTAPGQARVRKFFSSTQVKLAAFGSALLLSMRRALAALAGALLRLLKNLLPDADVLRIPPSTMVFIALAIPLVLATIGGIVYLQRGRTQQHEIYYQQAVEDATYATSLSNPLEQRMAWLTVIGDLDKAEDYKVTSQSQDLRTEAMSNLDNLDAIVRLDYQQAIVGGLDSAVRVTRMVATATDLYLLNAAQGSVLRAIITGRGYEIDPNFQCGPTFGPIDVGPLIDIAELQPGAFEDASLLGLDANGNLLYCVIGSQPYSAAMAPPNTGFGQPTGMTLDRNDLYILDPQANAVWYYRNLEVSQQPRLFFGDDIPPMEDVIDLAAYNQDLYLLHADGHITKCTYSGLTESPTRCDDPYPYSDNRPGKVHGPTIEDTVFSQIYFLSFPERSIYLLDPHNQAIFYFSVLLNLQNQYQPIEPITEGDATAFAISPNRTSFLAVGNYVYYAAMP